MKGLASVLVGIVLLGITGIAGPLEFGVGVGPTFTSLDSLNASIGVLNSLIGSLNDTFAIDPNVSGSVDPMPTIGTGLYLTVAEQYRLNGWLALGAHVEYTESSSSTAGTYQGSDTSEIDLFYRSQLAGGILCGDVTFVDLGLQLGAIGGVGYFYSIVSRNIVFQVPDEYPDAIAGLPPEGEGRYTGGGLGLEAGLSLSYPLFPWFTVGSQVLYRMANVRSLHAGDGTGMDLNGDGRDESLNLSGLAVQFSFSINIDLSFGGGKESAQ
jgi:hypothetical protein